MKVTWDIPVKAKEIGKRLDGLVAAYKAQTLGARWGCMGLKKVFLDGQSIPYVFSP